MATRFNNAQLDQLLATSKGKSYTVIVVTVALIIVILLAGVFPAASAILLQVSENQNREAALQKVELKDSVLRKLVTQEKAKRAVSLALSSYFPDNITQENIYSRVAKIAADSKVEILAINFSELEDRRSLIREFKVPASVQGKNMGISLKGNREQLESFMEKIELSLRIMNILSVSEFRQEGARAGEHRMEIQAEIYYWSASEIDE
jgi:Tfp pilus assembly protein PilO